SRHLILSRVRVAFFTAGTLGAGHLVRGRAIGRALARAGFRGSYRMFGPAGPPARFSAAARGGCYEEVAIEERVLLDPVLARESPLARALEAFSPDVLLVDMFWAPLGNIL